MRMRTGFRLLLLASALALAAPVATAAEFSLSVVVAPPPLPVYVQPPCPAPGYIWTPGYWAWGPDGYYWVPGTWVMPPTVGLLWTPGYWGWSAGAYVWNPGYWGLQVGFYGGVVYGCGYDGDGFEGGYWRGDRFYYNTAVTNVNTTVVRNVYRRPVPERYARAVSYNGGPGGISARPTREQALAARGKRWARTSSQRRQERAARFEPSLRADVNHGHPPIAATERAGAFRGRNAVAAKGAPHGPAEYGRRPENRAYPQERGRKEARPSPRTGGPFSYGPPQGRKGEFKRTPEATPRPAPRNPKSERYQAPRNPKRERYQAPRVPGPSALRRTPPSYGRHYAPQTYARHYGPRPGAPFYSGSPRPWHGSRPARAPVRRPPMRRGRDRR